MTQDHQLKKILLQSAEEAKPDFTAAVMKRIVERQTMHAEYRPLVSVKIKKAFLYIFGTIITAILVLCLLITAGDSQMLRRIEALVIPGVDYAKALVYLIIFWGLFMVNVLVRRAGNKTHRSGS